MRIDVMIMMIRGSLLIPLSEVLHSIPGLQKIWCLFYFVFRFLKNEDDAFGTSC